MRILIVIMIAILPIAIAAETPSLAYEWLENSAAEVKIANNQLAKQQSTILPTICRGHFNLATYPGRLTNSGCEIAATGHVFFETEYETLVAFHKTEWLKKGALEGFLYQANWPKRAGLGPVVLPQNRWPQNFEPVIGGEAEQANLYICRVKLNDQLYTGHIKEDGCVVAVDNHETTQPNYDVLFIEK